jgi:phospholipase C
VDSEETEFENAAGPHILDANPATYWHTKWFGQDPPHPHDIILELGAVRTVYGIIYLPRQDGDLNGTIVGYEVYISLDRDTWTPTLWMSGSWEPTANEKIAVQSRGQQGRYLKLEATSAANNRPWTSAAEIKIIGELH